MVSLLHFSFYFKDCEAIPVLLWFTAEIHSRRNGLVFHSVSRFRPSVKALSSTSCEPSDAYSFQHNGLSLQTYAQHLPLTNFSGSLPRPLLHELRFLVSLQAAHSSHSVRASTTELPGALALAPRRVRAHPGFTPVARLSSHAALRPCFRPGTRMGLPHQPPAHCLPSRGRTDTKSAVPTTSRQR